MHTYATQQDLIDRFGSVELVQLTDRTNAGVIDADVVARALSDATALADSYLAKAYGLPLATVPDVLTRVTADIARYYLHGKAAENDGAVARAHTHAVAWLRDVARGVVSLSDEGVQPAQAGGGAVHAEGPARLMTRDSLKGY